IPASDFGARDYPVAVRVLERYWLEPVRSQRVSDAMLLIAVDHDRWHGLPRRQQTKSEQLVVVRRRIHGEVELDFPGVEHLHVRHVFPSGVEHGAKILELSRRQTERWSEWNRDQQVIRSLVIMRNFETDVLREESSIETELDLGRALGPKIRVARSADDDSGNVRPADRDRLLVEERDRVAEVWLPSRPSARRAQAQ